MNKIVAQLKAEVDEVLIKNILPYWMSKLIDLENGGFKGRIAGNEVVIDEAPKGVVLNARILWTFAAAYRVYKNESYLQTAKRAKDYLLNYFYDKEHGGVYWLLDYKGNPVETKKQIYAQGFAIYGLSEYYRATQDNDALKYAIKLFKSIEEHSFDKKNNGYLEALTQDWQLIDDMRLSEKDANVQKTMNTHLHILEPYTNLYRVWKDDFLKEQLKNLIELFLEKIIDDKTKHLKLFFDTNWKSDYDIISYGHDIEASWLLYETALVLNDAEVINKVRTIVPHIVKAAEEGLEIDGSMVYEKNIQTKHTDKEKHWWVQAEAVIGFLNHYQYYNNEDSLKKALDCWNYIKKNIIDWNCGEWFWSVFENGSINRDEDKAGVWKCPYHNSRMCMEIIERF
ncbi:MAG: N-acyl-D-glucosamine 2-epimerase [Bacteroidales bacterium]|nr:N-acyl-D-glucosamine 2-epimerase [Bacteroidales bacterium]